MFSTAPRDIPRAVTARGGTGSDEEKYAIQWAVRQHKALGGTLLVLTPGRRNGQESLLRELGKARDAVDETWRTYRSARWSGGVVLAAWPTPKVLAELEDDGRARAIVVLPWIPKDVQAWTDAYNPSLLGEATAPKRIALDPVVEAALRDLTHSVNHANHLAGSLDRRDAVAILQTLSKGGYQLAPDAIYTWALANGWPARGAERLKEFATNFAEGRRMRLGTAFPFRPDILQVWEREARGEEV